MEPSATVEHQLFIGDVDLDHIARPQGAPGEQLGDRVDDLPLEGPTQRPRAEAWIRARVESLDPGLAESYVVDTFRQVVCRSRHEVADRWIMDDLERVCDVVEVLIQEERKNPT